MTTNTLNHKKLQPLWKILIEAYLKKVIKDKNEKVSPKKTKQLQKLTWKNTTNMI